MPVLSTPRNEVQAGSNGGVNMVFSDPCQAPLTSGQTAQTAACESGSASDNFDSLGNASAGGGAVHVGASAAAGSSGTTPYNANGSAYGQAIDSFAISGPANTSATLTGSFVLGGALDVAVSGAPQTTTSSLASYSFDAGLSGAANVSQSGVWLRATNGTDQQSNVSGGIFPVSSSFQFGPDGWAVFTISMRGSVTAEGNAIPYLPCTECALVPGSFSSAANFGGTIYWGGIDSITVDGVPLASFGYQASASGVDYRVATVPEPSTVWLVGSSLAALLALRRQR